MPSKSSTGANADTAPPSPSAEVTPLPKPSDLKARVLSAIILAPPVLAAVWYGGMAFDLLMLLVAVLSLLEWVRLIAPQARPLLRGMCTAFVVAICVWAIVHGAASAVPVAMVLVVAVAALVPWFDLGPTPHYHRPGLWLAVGLLYLGLAATALIYLRGDAGQDGRGLFLFLLLAVWATDIGAYAAGRLIGGPKLMPRISPKKTWAGLIGGMVASGLVGWMVAIWVLHAAAPGLVALVAAVLAVVGQAGDFFESFIKRRSQVKDSGTLIPGHGGLLDRIDGLMAAALALAAFHGLSHEALPWW